MKLLILNLYYIQKKYWDFVILNGYVSNCITNWKMNIVTGLKRKNSQFILLFDFSPLGSVVDLRN